MIPIVSVPVDASIGQRLVGQTGTKFSMHRYSCLDGGLRNHGTVFCSNGLSRRLCDGPSCGLYSCSYHLHHLGLHWTGFRYSDTWQLIINTGTTVLTFLAVFLIQNSQNRDGAAIQAKLDELLRSMVTARSGFVGIEKLTDSELDRLKEALEREVLQMAHDPAGNSETEVDVLLRDSQRPDESG